MAGIYKKGLRVSIYYRCVEGEEIKDTGKNTNWKTWLALVFFVTGIVYHVSLLTRINSPGLQKMYFDVANPPLRPDGTHTPGIDFNALYVQGGNLVKGESIYTSFDELVGNKPREVDIEDVNYFGLPEEKLSEKAADLLPPYRYLPAAALVGTPFTFLPFRSAYNAWIVFHELLILFSLYLLYKSTKNSTLALTLCGMLLWFAPYYVEIFQGQFSWLQAFLMLLCIFHLECRTPIWGMWAFIASVLWKLNTLLWIFPLWFGGYRKWLIWLLAAIIIASVPYFIIHPEDITGFLAINLHPDTGHTFTFGNSGLRMFVDFVLRWTDNSSGDAIPNFLVKWLSLLIALCIFGLTILATWRNRKDTVGNLLIFGTVYFLIYVDVWMHHWLMILPVVIWEYRRTRSPFVFIIWLILALPTRFDWIGEMSELRLTSPDMVANFPAAFLYFGQKAVPAFVLWIWQYKRMQSKDGTNQNRMRREG